MLYVPSPQGAVPNIRPPTLGPLTIVTPIVTDALGDALMLPSRCGFTGGCISAAFMTRNA